MGLDRLEDDWARVHGIGMRWELLKIVAGVSVTPFGLDLLERVNILDDVLTDLAYRHVVVDWHVIFHRFEGVYVADRNMHAGALLEGY